MNIPKILSVTPQSNLVLLITFSDGTRKKYDVHRLLKYDMFSSLSNPAFFNNVQIEQGGYAVSWNSEIDISEYELWKNGEEFI